jgi:hypothetical protein
MYTWAIMKNIILTTPPLPTAPHLFTTKITLELIPTLLATTIIPSENQVYQSGPNMPHLLV